MSRQTSHADVLVIGAGPSGAVVSHHLAQNGFRVVCLEQGDWHGQSAYPTASTQRELRSTGPWSADPNVRAWPADYPVDAAGSEIAPVFFNGVGGSTVLFGGEWSRMLPGDFRRRSLYGVMDDWPISYADLEAGYARAEELFHVSSRPGDPAMPSAPATPHPALPIGEVGRRAAEGANRLGWHWWPGSHAIATHAGDGMGACARRGVCGEGCPEGAKASADVAVWPKAIRAGARLVTGARVSRVTHDDRGRATGAEWTDNDGREHRQTADVVILAASAIGTPRLLLLSASDRYPDGMANGSGLVGKRLMMHPFRSVLGVYDEPLRSWLGPKGHPVMSYEFLEPDGARGFVGAIKLSISPVPGPLVTSRRLKAAGEPFEQRTGTAIQERMATLTGRVFEWSVAVEDAPDERNRVTLAHDALDSSGLPGAKVRYAITDTARAALDFGVARAHELHRAADASEIRDTSWGPAVGWHLAGTTRMGTDPGTSVLDRNCRAHDVENLYVADSSSFVTFGASNPTATVAAIAQRLAGHLTQDAGLVRPAV